MRRGGPITRSSLSRTRSGGVSRGPAQQPPVSAYVLYMNSRSRGTASSSAPPIRPASGSIIHSNRIRGEPYTIGDDLFFDLVSVGKCDVVKIKLLCMQDLKEGDENECPIGMVPFDTVSIDCVGSDETFLKSHPDRCIAVLPCGHMFGALTLVYQAMVVSMRCPMCRQGINRRMRPSCVPQHLRSIFMQGLNKVMEEEAREEDDRNRAAIQNIISEGFSSVVSMGMPPISLRFGMSTSRGYVEWNIIGHPVSRQNNNVSLFFDEKCTASLFNQ